MIEVVIEEMHGSDRMSEPEIDYERALGWLRTIIYESEMALFLECMQMCAQKVVDTADIVRDAIFRQQPADRPDQSGQFHHLPLVRYYWPRRQLPHWQNNVPCLDNGQRPAAYNQSHESWCSRDCSFLNLALVVAAPSQEKTSPALAPNHNASQEVVSKVKPCSSRVPPPCANAPSIIKAPNPEYSEEAQKKRIVGTVASMVDCGL